MLDLRSRRLLEAIEVLAGTRGPKDSHAVTFADLASKDAATRIAKAGGGFPTQKDVDKIDDAIKDYATAWGLLAGLAEATASQQEARDALFNAQAFRDKMLSRIGVNYVRTGAGTDGIGDWINGVTTSTDVPAHAPAGAKSLVFTAAQQTEKPLYNENLKGRTIRASGWIKSATDTAYFRARGSSTNDPDGNSLVSPNATLAPAAGWRAFAVEFKGETDTTHWGPSIGFAASGSALVYGLRFDDVTGAVQQIEKLEAGVTGGLTASVIDHKAAIADLKGNALAYVALIAEIENGKIAGIRAQAFNDAAAGVAGSLLELLGDNVIAEGTMSVGRLNVGLGKNMLGNTRFRHRLQNWLISRSGDQVAETTGRIRSPGETWASAFYPTLELGQVGAGDTGEANFDWTDATADGVSAPGISVDDVDYIEVSVSAAALRCEARVVLRWYDDAGTWISSSYNAPHHINDQVPSSSSNPNLWPRLWIIAARPANAAFASIRLQKGPTLIGSSSYAFFHKPQLAVSHAGAKGPAPYSEDGAVLITPSGIVTPSLSAISATLGAIIVERANIAAAAIGTLQVEDASMLTEKLGLNATTKLSAIVAPSGASETIVFSGMTAGWQIQCFCAAMHEGLTGAGTPEATLTLTQNGVSRRVETLPVVSGQKVLLQFDHVLSAVAGTNTIVLTANTGNGDEVIRNFAAIVNKGR